MTREEAIKVLEEFDRNKFSDNEEEHSFMSCRRQAIHLALWTMRYAFYKTWEKVSVANESGTHTEYQCPKCKVFQLVRSNYCPQCGENLTGEARW